MTAIYLVLSLIFGFASIILSLAIGGDMSVQEPNFNLTYCVLLMLTAVGLSMIAGREQFKSSLIKYCDPDRLNAERSYEDEVTLILAFTDGRIKKIIWPTKLKKVRKPKMVSSDVSPIEFGGGEEPE